MMEVLWTPEAVSDREAIYDYIEADNPQAAFDIDDLISAKTAMLQEHPRIGRAERVPGTFELVIHSSYMVVYDISKAQVRIMSVVHTAKCWPPLQK